MRSMVEGLTLKNPSTALRAVPLPAKSRGGPANLSYNSNRERNVPASKQPSLVLT
jgi:hypothetical protein